MSAVNRAGIMRLSLDIFLSSEIYFSFAFPVFALPINSSNKLFVSQDKQAPWSFYHVNAWRNIFKGEIDILSRLKSIVRDASATSVNAEYLLKFY